MKQIFTFPLLSKILVLFGFVMLVTYTTAAQSYPVLHFSNGALSAGTDKQVGATYTFTNVTTGVNASVHIDSLIGGAAIATLDSVGTGYNEAFQPIVTSQPGKASYAVMTISFTDQKNNPHTYTFANLTATAIDVDGDNVSTKEYVGINMIGGIASAAVLTSTSTVALTIVAGAGFRGDNTDAKTLSGIDTSNYNGMFKVQNTNVSTITFRFGATIPLTGKAETRFHSIYFNDFKVQSGSPSSNSRVTTTLPVKFSFFQAARNNKNTELRWQTATEINNKGFYVQKKTAGEWKDIAFVFSNTHNGSSNSLLYYNYTDLDIASSAVQYRIMQVDMDAKVSYSEVRTIVSDKQTGKVVLFPNPSLNGTVTISFDNSNAKEVQVSDLQGRMIKSYPAVNSNTLSLVNLNSGFYSVRILDLRTLQVTTGKVIVQK